MHEFGRVASPVPRLVSGVFVAESSVPHGLSCWQLARLVVSAVRISILLSPELPVAGVDEYADARCQRPRRRPLAPEHGNELAVLLNGIFA
jgi:hypothetical protein